MPTFKAKDIGFDRSMIGAYGHDDKVCAYPALVAAFDAGVPEDTCVTYLADKEEIGSDGNTGMQSDFLRYFIYDLAAQDGVEGYRALSKSICLSADVNAAFDPTYASAFEAQRTAAISTTALLSQSTRVTAASTTPPTRPQSIWAKSAPCSRRTTFSGKSAS